MINLGRVPAGTVRYIPFDTYDANGASVTISGFAVTDIEIYKNGSITQRSSDNGYALLDTDGIDFDGTTGLQGFSVDLGDNSDSGFYAAGSQYWLNINAITIDSQTVRFTYLFEIVPAESSAGVPKVDVSHNGGSAITSSSGRQEVNTTHAAGTAWNSGAIGPSTLASDTIAAAKIASNAFTSAKFATGALANGVFGAGAIDNAVLAADTLTANKIHSDVTTELQSGLATLSGQMGQTTTINTIAADVVNLDGSSAADIATAVRTNLGAELGRIDAAITSRMASYTQPTGFLAATFPTTVASTTNITAAAGVTLGTNGLPAAAVHVDAAAKVADVTLRRHMANAEASSFGDSLDVSSLYGLAQQQQAAEVNDPNIDVYKTDLITLLGSIAFVGATSSEVIVNMGGV